jgi:hypothetical protein
MAELRNPAAPQGEVDAKTFRGSWLLYRKAGSGMRRVKGDAGGADPKFRHPSRQSADAEARRLLGHHPKSTFIILQEVGRVKLKDAPHG